MAARRVGVVSQATGRETVITLDGEEARLFDWRGYAVGADGVWRRAVTLAPRPIAHRFVHRYQREAREPES